LLYQDVIADVNNYKIGRGGIMKRMLSLGAAVIVCLLVVLSAQNQASAFTVQEGFQGAYDPSKWEFSNVDTNGLIWLHQVPDTITLISGNLIGNIRNQQIVDSGYPGYTDFTVEVNWSGVISFDWAYRSDDDRYDAMYDSFGVLLNGVFDQLTWNGVGPDPYPSPPSPYSGTSIGPPLFQPPGAVSGGVLSHSVSVVQGDIFGFRINTLDNLADRAGAVITNFAAPIPEPASMLLFGSGLIGLAGFRRRFKK